MTGRENESDEGCREKHLDNGNVAIVAAEYSIEGLGVVDAEALGGSHSQAAVVLIEGDEVESRIRHGDALGPQGFRKEIALCS